MREKLLDIDCSVQVGPISLLMKTWCSVSARCITQKLPSPRVYRAKIMHGMLRNILMICVFRLWQTKRYPHRVVVRGSSGLDDPNAQKPLLVTVSIVGPDASGTQTYWAQALPISCDAGATAADATLQALMSAGLTYNYSAGYLSSITSPYTGEALGWDAETNAYWQLWINDSYAQVGASQLYLSEGDRVEWRYAADGESGLPESPDQPGEDDEQNWSEIGTATSSNVTKAPTPTGKVEEAWSIELMDPSNFLPVSEPVVAGEKIFIAVGNRLMSLSADDRSVEASVSLSSWIDYTCRPCVSQGVLYVPLSGGVVEAYSLPTLTRLWTSEPTARADQSSCSLTIMEKDGMSIVVYGTAAFGSAGYSSGSCVALNAQTGKARPDCSRLTMQAITGQEQYSSMALWL